MLYEYECTVCGRRFEKVNSVKDRYNAFCCGQKALKLITDRIYCPDDLIYQFDANFFGNKPVNIYSRKQYKSLLKKHNLADATVKECLSVKPKEDNCYKSERRKIAKNLAEKMYQSQVNHAVKSWMKDFFVKKEI